MNKSRLRYAILKEIDNGNQELSAVEFKVDEDVFDDAIRYLDREGYISGFIYADNRPWSFGTTVYLTGKGEDYLSGNSKLAKAYRGLKEIRDWLK